ncbi:MAG: hypothetical protein HYW25_00420 [Candidatus Aenigmarchaeota archaeon]|nr:hypothetical protein [Candidatus Aenigmarchaeota archaeon]
MPRKILFVCMYNAGRSPFAEYAMRQALDERGIEGVEVYSAGLSEGTRESLPAPSPVLEASMKLGVNVAGHRRKRLTEEMVKRANEIYVFEREHQRQIQAAYPEAEWKVYVLREIQDLKGTPVETHVKHLREIRDAVEELVEKEIAAG